MIESPGTEVAGGHIWRQRLSPHHDETAHLECVVQAHDEGMAHAAEDEALRLRARHLQREGEWSHGPGNSRDQSKGQVDSRDWESPRF